MIIFHSVLGSLCQTSLFLALSLSSSLSLSLVCLSFYQLLNLHILVLMYAEFSQISLLGMSNSELFLVKEEEERVEFDGMKQPMSAISSLDCHEEKGGGEDKVTAEKNKTPSLGEFKATEDDDDDNDGFKTPTSVDHKISSTRECPPAPRKPKASSNKRKAPSTSSPRPKRPLDLSQDVESLFPRPLLADFHRKIKKARTE